MSSFSGTLTWNETKHVKVSCASENQSGVIHVQSCLRPDNPHTSRSAHIDTSFCDVCHIDPTLRSAQFLVSCGIGLTKPHPEKSLFGAFCSYFDMFSQTAGSVTLGWHQQTLNKLSVFVKLKANIFKSLHLTFQIHNISKGLDWSHQTCFLLPPWRFVFHPSVYLSVGVLRNCWTDSHKTWKRERNRPKRETIKLWHGSTWVSGMVFLSILWYGKMGAFLLNILSLKKRLFHLKQIQIMSLYSISIKHDILLKMHVYSS